MRIVLVGNYSADGQESMLRYAEMMLAGLAEADHDVRLVAPKPVLNRTRRGPTGVSKWIGYLDKYWLGTRQMAAAVHEADLVHICDHSNAVYVPRATGTPYVVTCHDLLAVRGALGEDTDCPASLMGRQLQRMVLHGLRRAQAIACVSQATLSDAQRLLGPRYPGCLMVTPNALNYPYGPLEASEVARRLKAVPRLGERGRYVLLVGSNLRRKNREIALHAIARIAHRWDGLLVFAGQPLSPELRNLAVLLGVRERVLEVSKPSNMLLEALYNGAQALIFPSRFEGFGWPIIEAQACGCPVICSDRAPLPEVAGTAAIECDADDAEAFGNAILRLESDAIHRDKLREAGLRNAERFTRAAMIKQFLALYAEVGAGS